MYCIKCGKENENTAKFCKFCGTPLRPKSLPDSQVQNRDKKEKKREKEKPENGAKSGRQKWWIILIVILALLLLVCAIFIFNRASTERVVQWQEQYDLGVKYLESGSYEQAILAFEAALEIDPKSVDTYLSLAAAQSAVGDGEAANETITRGLVETGDEQLAVWPLQQKPAAEQTPEPTSTPAVNDEKMEDPDDQLNDEVDYDNLVTDAYAKDCTYTANMYNYETGESEETEKMCTFRIPKINLSGNVVEQINVEIYNALYLIIEDSVEEIIEYGYPFSSEEISYRWAINGNILSLVILNSSAPDWGGGNVYMVYNIDISSGEEVSTASLIQTAGFSEAEYYEKAKQVLGSSFWSNWDPSNENFGNQSFVDFFNEQLQRTVSDDNIAQSYPYINENGQLCIIAKQYSMAAADYYWHDLNMIEFELSPYYVS